MSSKINLLDLLKKNDSIKLGLEAKDWKEAIKLSTQPLIDKKVITNDYYDAIIESTKKHGPYYIIAEGLAMPHAQSDRGVNENGFSLITLKEPIYFENDPRPVDVLITLAATSPEIHTSEALPQIVAVFEDEKNIKKIAKAKTVDEVIEIISSSDFTKYLN